jgi:hypothetical protein
MLQSVKLLRLVLSSLQSWESEASISSVKLLAVAIASATQAVLDLYFYCVTRHHWKSQSRQKMKQTTEGDLDETSILPRGEGTDERHHSLVGSRDYSHCELVFS